MPRENLGYAYDDFACLQKFNGVNIIAAVSEL